MSNDYFESSVSKKFIKYIASKLLALLIIAVIFGVINLIMYGIQELIHAPEINQINIFDGELKTLKTSIDNYSAQIDIISNQKKEIESLEIKIKGYPLNYLSDYDYNKDVDYFNYLVNGWNINLKLNKNIIESYNTLINNYNNKVDERNKLAKNAYTRWYLIPIPGRSHSDFTPHLNPIK